MEILAMSWLAEPRVHRKSYRRLELVDELQRARQLSLANWKIVTHGHDAFNVEAGAFEIEYFQGQTNIRVLDLSRVTIEGAARGKKSELALVFASPFISSRRR